MFFRPHDTHKELSGDHLVLSVRHHLRGLRAFVLVAVGLIVAVVAAFSVLSVRNPQRLQSILPDELAWLTSWLVPQPEILSEASLEKWQEALEKARLEREIEVATRQELERQIVTLKEELKDVQTELEFVRSAKEPQPGKELAKEAAKK